MWAPASATPGAYANGVTAVPGISTRESWQAPYQPRCPCRSGTETGHLRTQPSLSLSKGLDWQLAILLEHCIIEKEWGVKARDKSDLRLKLRILSVVLCK